MTDEKPLKYIPMAWKILALVAAAICVVFFFIVLIAGGDANTPRAASIIFLIIGPVYLLFFWTIGDVINLLIRIDSNTRKE